jgi:hypothetical protein
MPIDNNRLIQEPLQRALADIRREPMISEDLLGRWECIGNYGGKDHYKFYTILYDEKTNTYTCMYGKIDGAPTQIKTSAGCSEAHARKKIQGMRGKHYEHVGGPTRVEQPEQEDLVVIKKASNENKFGLGKRKIRL